MREEAAQMRTMSAGASGTTLTFPSNLHTLNSLRGGHQMSGYPALSARNARPHEQQAACLIEQLRPREARRIAAQRRYSLNPRCASTSRLNHNKTQQDAVGRAANAEQRVGSRSSEHRYLRWGAQCNVGRRRGGGGRPSCYASMRRHFPATQHIACRRLPSAAYPTARGS